MIHQGNERWPVREIILHCAAIRTGQFAGMRPFEVFMTVNRWHVERGWKGFGYHGLIMPDGGFYTGRPFDQEGAHCAGKNRGTLGFLLIESRKIEHVGAFADWFIEAQGDALRRLIAAIPGIETVSGHNDHAARLCPGFKVETSDWL